MKFTDFDTRDGVNYDLPRDVLVYMRNHPDFYRREYFPTMAIISDSLVSQKDIDPTAKIKPMVEKGCSMYSQEFGVGDIFTNEDFDSIVSMIMDEEGELLQKGDY